MKYPAVPWFLGLMTALVAPLSAQPVEVPATDPLVRYVGRFDRADAAGPRCAWSASAVAVTFTGGSLGAKLGDSGQNFWQIVVDGTPTGALTLQKGEHVYPVASGLSEGTHTVELIKRTEFFAGVTQVEGFQLAVGAKLMPTPARAHRIEVIGDSINADGGPKARLIDFGVQSPANGIGANWHPGAKTHALMGAQLARALKTDLGW